jgi:signal transduction histidine kinase
MASSNFDTMSADLEGVTDTESHSKLAFAALALLVPGLLAPIEPRLAFISGIACAFAFVVMLFAGRRQYSAASKRIASFVLVVGAVLTAWSLTAKYFTQITRQKEAVEVASQYMDALANNRMLDAISMVGLTPMVRDVEMYDITKEQRSVRMYLEDSTLKQIKSRGTEAKWKSLGVQSVIRDHEVYTFTVRFIDESRQSPVPYDVEVKFSPPTKYSDPVDKWLVDGINLGRI